VLDALSRFLVYLQGILFTLVAAKLNKVYVLSFTLTIWSVFTLLTGITDRFWQVAVVRIGQAVFEAGCTPFAAGIIAAYYPLHLKGTAMSVYNIGIYVGAARVDGWCISVIILLRQVLSVSHRVCIFPKRCNKHDERNRQMAGGILSTRGLP
jgi:MFS family permease